MLNYNKSKLSQTAQFLLKNGYGYRNNECYGNYIYDLRDVISFEIKELGNNDILYFFNKHYNTNFGLMVSCCKDDEINKEISQIYDIVCGALNTNSPYCMWLTTEEYVEELYSTDEYLVSCYKIPEDSIIMSDLGCDGILIATKNNPTTLKYY